MPAKVILEVVSGAIAGKRFEFDAHDTFLFGRHSTCHARLTNDPKVSRNHFLLEVNPPALQLRDLGSTNGTFVNDVKYVGRRGDGAPAGPDSVALKDGDRITVGETTIRVAVDQTPRCRSCGAEFGGDDGATLGEDVLCEKCRRPPAHPVHATTPWRPPAAGACTQCGTVMAAAAPADGKADNLCDACRRRMAGTDDGARRLLRNLLQKGPDVLRPAITGYKLDKKLGEGGMGVVYQAVRESDGKTVAVKLMLAKIAVDEDAQRVFSREIEVTRALKHPNIVGLQEHGAQRGAFYFVMDYCNGGSLDKLLESQGGRLPLEKALPLMLQILAGLEYAHAQKIVHRDLKPQNILLQSVAGHVTPRVADFGLAKNFEQAGFSGMTATGHVGGTLCYMAREQLTNFRTIRPVSDVWSIAATFYNMLTGAYPRNFRNDKDPIQVILNENPIPIRQRLSTIPEKLAQVVDKALNDDPAARHATIAELDRALKESLVE